MRAARSLLALGAVVAGSLVLVASAAALQPGVSVAPGSPAGREYSFPLSVLRNAATGHAPPTNGAQPLFGVGIAPAGTAAAVNGRSVNGRSVNGRSGSRGEGSGRQAGSGQGGGTGATASSSAGSKPLSNRATASLTRPSSSTPQLLVIGVLVVLGGLVLGVAIVAARRRAG